MAKRRKEKLQEQMEEERQQVVEQLLNPSMSTFGCSLIFTRVSKERKSSRKIYYNY